MARFTLFFLMGVSIVSVASAQDQCRDVLAAQLFDKAEGVKSAETQNAEFYWACSASLSEAKNYVSRERSKAQAAGGSFEYGLYGGDAYWGGSSVDNMTQDRLNKWQQENCSEVSSNQASSAFEYYANATVAGGVVQAWRDCMIAQQGLTCWANPQGNNIVFAMNWKNNDVELPVVRSARAIIGNTQEVIANPGEKILIGEDAYSVRRIPEQDALFELRVIHRDRFAYSCSAYVPAFREVAAENQHPDPRPAEFDRIKQMVENFPNGKITIATSDGLFTLLYAAKVAERLERHLGWSADAIDLEEGAIGLVAAEYPDGYSIFYAYGEEKEEAVRRLTRIGGTNFFVPKGTPQGIIDKLEQALGDA